MMRRFILTLEILFVSLFLLGGSFPETEAARNTSGGFSWKDYRTIAHALGGMDGKDYLNSREGFLFSMNREFVFWNWIFPGHPMEYGSAGITGTIPWDSGMATEKKSLQKRNSDKVKYMGNTPP